MLMMLPLPWACMARTSCFMLGTTPRTLVSNVASKLSAVWSVIGPTWPSVPALFTATSRRPNRATVLSTRACTSSSLRTSALMNSASEPKERSSLTSALPASSRRPATTTFAPFLAKATAAARPMPVSPPVINTTGVLMIDSLINLRFELGKLKAFHRSRDRGGGRSLQGGERLCRLGAIPHRHGPRHGAAPSSLFRRRRRGGQPYRGGGAAAAYGPAFAEPSDPGS